MKSSIKYSKIISDICPGMIILTILYYYNKNIFKIDISCNIEEIGSSLLSFGFIIFISIFIGKIVNLLGYIVQRYLIRKINYLLMSKICFPYYKKYWFLIKINNFTDYKKLNIIKLLVQNHPSSQHDFDNDESVKRLMRTTTFIIIILTLFTLYKNLKVTITTENDYWEIIIYAYKQIYLILPFLISYICFLFITCFVYIYLYYKYIEQAIIITKGIDLEQINNLVCDGEKLNQLINALCCNFPNVDIEKNKNIADKGDVEIEE